MTTSRATKVKESREMRLTPDLVARVPRTVEDTGLPTGLVMASPEDHQAAVHELLAGAPSNRDVWILAYGSLIWNPVHEIAEERVATLHGWHRSFCLGWDRRFRGTPERPGLMMALDRGGACKGIAQRLPPGGVDANLLKIIRREMPVKGRVLPPRWVTVRTSEGTVPAIAFIINRDGGRYVGGLPIEEVADVLASAVGIWGSMAEYLYSTVSHLEQRGLHDPHLWRLQELVAERIEAAEAIALPEVARDPM